MNVQISDLRFVFNGKKLNDSKSIMFHGIETGSMLHVVFALTGGGFVFSKLSDQEIKLIELNKEIELVKEFYEKQEKENRDLIASQNNKIEKLRSKKNELAVENKVNKTIAETLQNTVNRQIKTEKELQHKLKKIEDEKSKLKVELIITKTQLLANLGCLTVRGIIRYFENECYGKWNIPNGYSRYKQWGIFFDKHGELRSKMKETMGLYAKKNKKSLRDSVATSATNIYTKSSECNEQRSTGGLHIPDIFSPSESEFIRVICKIEKCYVFEEV